MLGPVCDSADNTLVMNKCHNKDDSLLDGYRRNPRGTRQCMLLKVLFIYWPLLAIAVATILCTLIHRAKAADRVLRIQRQDRRPREQGAHGQGKSGDDDSDRRAA
jgi:hypothetical protein